MFVVRHVAGFCGVPFATDATPLSYVADYKRLSDDLTVTFFISQYDPHQTPPKIAIVVATKEIPLTAPTKTDH